MALIKVILFIAVTLIAQPIASAADPQQPLAGHSFPFFYLAPTESGIVEVHRAVLVFGPDAAKCELFPANIEIPYTGTVKMQRSGKRGSALSDFSAKGEAPYGKGLVSFTANKDGAGAKGQVIITIPGKAPVTVAFEGSKPKE